MAGSKTIWEADDAGGLQGTMRVPVMSDADSGPERINVGGLTLFAIAALLAQTNTFTEPQVFSSTIDAPDNDQLKIKAVHGSMGFLSYSPGDQEIHMDVEWSGGEYLATNTTISMIAGLGDYLQFFINDGQTVGQPTTGDFNTPRMTINATTGAMQILNLAGSGVRMVVVEADGTLSSESIPTPPGPVGRKITASGPVTMTDDDGIVEIAQTIPASCAVTGPPSPTEWQVYTIKDGAGNAGSFPITITPSSGNIDGRANFRINTNWGSLSFYSDGTNLRIV